jgi:hypothetical protein
MDFSNLIQKKDSTSIDAISLITTKTGKKAVVKKVTESKPKEPKKTATNRLNSKKGLSRQKAIESCDTCDGNPQVRDFQTVGFCGQVCANDECMLIINYKKI